MYKVYPIGIIIILSFLIGCEEEMNPSPPDAEFSADNNGCVEPCTLSFYDNSQFSSSIQWDFGNNITGTDSIELVPYDSAGLYTVTLEASNNEGASDIEEKTITINPSERMRVLKMVLIRFPELNDSQQPWDPASDADIYLALMNEEGDTLVSTAANLWSDIDNMGLPLFKSTDTLLTEITTTYSLAVIEKDASATTTIHKFPFHIYDYPAYPPNIFLEQDSTKVKMNLTWE